MVRAAFDEFNGRATGPGTAAPLGRDGPRGAFHRMGSGCDGQGWVVFRVVGSVEGVADGVDGAALQADSDVGVHVGGDAEA